jgi:phosphatidylglycerophosphate synthase
MPPATPSAAPPARSMATPPAAPMEAPPAWLVATRESPGPPVELFGLSLEERLRRSLRSAGVTRCERLGPDERPQPPAGGSLLLLRADAVYDERLVRGLRDAPGALLVAGSPRGASAVAAHVPAGCALEALALLREVGAGEAPPASLRVVTPRDLAPAYAAALRKLEPPFLFERVRPADARGIEDHLFAASYKGLTDLVTKWVWPRPASALVRALARRRVHPNSVTVASWVLAILAFALFVAGWHGAGLLVAWLMTFLDTVDGKLARCTLTSSRFGHALDHSLDLVHPPFWWWAFGVGLGEGAGWATVVAVAGYFAGRLLEGLFLWRLGFEIFSWRPVDGLFRTVIARRNPNLLLLSVGALGGRPDLGLVMVALWTLACLGFHAIRVAQALLLHARGERVAPWNEADTQDTRPSVSAGNGRGGEQAA